MNIFTKLKSMKSPVDMAAAIDTIKAEIATTEAEIEALQGQRETALFDQGEQAILDLQRQMAAKRDRLDLLRVALSGSEKRKADAEAEAEERQLKDRHRDAVARTAEEKKLLKAWHAAAKALAEITDDLAKVQRAMAAHNGAMRSIGRNDLLAPSIAAREVNAARLELWQAHCAAHGYALTNPPATVGLDVPNAFQIEGYWPRRPVSDPGKEFLGPPLALLN